MTDDDDTKFTKLFVGGIPYHTEDETMKQYFLQFDDIVEAVIIRERNSQRSKGYGFVTMATKEGAQRAIVNKRPVIDGRRANVDLAYIGAKPKTPKEAPQQDGTVSPKCSSVPSSPTISEQSFHSESGTEWVAEKQYTSSSFHGNVMYGSVHPAHATSPHAMMISPLDVKPTTVSSMQTGSPNLPPMSTMDCYQRNSQSYSSPGCSAISVGPKYLDHQRAVNLVTYLPHGFPVTATSESLAPNAVQCQPVFTQSPPHSTKPIPSPAYVYAVPVWYVDQGRVSCGQISLDPNYFQAPLTTAGMNGNINCGFQASGKLYTMPATYC